MKDTDSRALDRLVAEKVLGWRLDRHQLPEWVSPRPVYSVGYDADGRSLLGDFPRFSQDIASAWEVVKHLERDYAVTIRTVRDESVNRYVCTLMPMGTHSTMRVEDREHRAYAPSAPLAVCRAALAALGVKDEDDER